MRKEIRIAGFGGQGVMLAATVLGRAAAIQHGGYATMTESYGPEARGGASSAQLVLSDEPVLYPYVGEADVLVVLSQEAYSRFAGTLKPGGMLIVEDELVRIDRTSARAQVFGVPATRLAEELGRKIVLNIVMVGFFAAVSGLLEPADYEGAIADVVPPKVRDLNLRAFAKGYEYGQALREGKVAPSLEEVAAPELSL
ncbi:MAG: 2-oxoacid:acceptor oxidoreductase family protein [Bryobacteraceae bacterium]|nr:2-oxoacid:acceptor oxidoreductase family protein [Bryobacteraceae bacterium]